MILNTFLYTSGYDALSFLEDNVFWQDTSVWESGLHMELHIVMIHKYANDVVLVDMFCKSLKSIGAGAATIGVAGAGVGIGLVFSAFITACAGNADRERQLFSYAILGFALSEAIALFALMMAFIILFL
jgi:F-type H+-transporting ATPase subunit c